MRSATVIVLAAVMAVATGTGGLNRIPITKVSSTLYLDGSVGHSGPLDYEGHDGHDGSYGLDHDGYDGGYGPGYGGYDGGYGLDHDGHDGGYGPGYGGYNGGYNGGYGLGHDGYDGIHELPLAYDTQFIVGYSQPFGSLDGFNEVAAFLPFGRGIPEHSDADDVPVPLPGIHKPDVILPIHPASLEEGGVPPLPVLPILAGRTRPALDNERCGPHRLLKPCSKYCSLEWNPVLAKCEDGRVVRFINCCSWHRDVCLFKRKCTFLRSEGPLPCDRDSWD